MLKPILEPLIVAPVCKYMNTDFQYVLPIIRVCDEFIYSGNDHGLMVRIHYFTVFVDSNSGNVNGGDGTGIWP